MQVVANNVRLLKKIITIAMSQDAIKKNLHHNEKVLYKGGKSPTLNADAHSGLVSFWSAHISKR